MNNTQQYISLQQEERWNVISHGAGIILSLVGLIYLTIVGAYSHLDYGLFASISFGLSLLLLYTASTLYHYYCLKKKQVAKTFQVIDHIAIYLLIAGTYTPFTLLVLGEGNGWWIFSIIWSLAGLGTLFKLFFMGRFPYLSLAIYLFMGWLVIFDFYNLYLATKASTLSFLMLGGIFYTVGVYFFANERIPYNHVIWHIFVLLGSIFHFASVASIF